MRTIFHGSRVTGGKPEIRIQEFYKDFYWGFYCTEFETQTVRWATRFGSGKSGRVVNFYDVALTIGDRFEGTVPKG